MRSVKYFSSVEEQTECPVKDKDKRAFSLAVWGGIEQGRGCQILVDFY